MMRKWWTTVGCAATLLLTACPYHGRVPLGPPQPELFDERLLGEWIADSDGDLLNERLWVARFDDDEYVVAGLGSCPAGGGRAYLTTLGGRSFLNLREETQEGRYRIGRIELEDSVLRLTQLSDSLDDATTSEALRERLLTGFDDPGLYEKTATYRRTGTAPAATGVGAMAVLPQACAYDGDVLLEETVADSVLNGIVGSWVAVFNAGTVEFEVRRGSGGSAQLTFVTTLDWEGEETVVGEGYFTRIRDALFLNSHGDGGTMLARLSVAGDTAELRMVNSGVVADSPAALRQLLEERLDDPLIYVWEPLRLVRRP